MKKAQEKAATAAAYSVELAEADAARAAKAALRQKKKDAAAAKKADAYFAREMSAIGAEVPASPTRVVVAPVATPPVVARALSHGEAQHAQVQAASMSGAPPPPPPPSYPAATPPRANTGAAAQHGRGSGSWAAGTPALTQFAQHQQQQQQLFQQQQQQQHPQHQAVQQQQLQQLQVLQLQQLQRQSAADDAAAAASLWRQQRQQKLDLLLLQQQLQQQTEQAAAVTAAAAAVPATRPPTLVGTPLACWTCIQVGVITLASVASVSQLLAFCYQATTHSLFIPLFFLSPPGVGLASLARRLLWGIRHRVRAKRN
jgi:hypothetical protein